MKIAIFYEHILDAVKQEGMSLEAVLEAVHKMGYSGLECDYAKLCDDPKKFYETITKAGLEVSGVYKFCDFPHDINTDDLTKFVEDVETVGSKKILCIPGFIDDEANRDDYTDKMVEGLKILCDIAERKGITVSLEDFDDIKAPFCTPMGLRMLMDRVPKIKYTYDTGNFYYCDEDELDAFELLKDRLTHVHLKDRALSLRNEGEEAKPTISGKIMYPTPVGQGVIHIKEATEKALAAGYNGYFTAEHFGSTQELKYMEETMSWLKANLL